MKFPSPQVICSVYPFTLSEYSPVLVSTLMISPVSTNNGIRTFAPVSTVASFRVLVAVLPLSPGSV